MLAVLAPLTVAAGEDHEVVAPKVAEVECANPGVRLVRLSIPQ